MQKVLITGATGYLGEKLVSNLKTDSNIIFLIPMRAKEDQSWEDQCSDWIERNSIKSEQVEFFNCDLSSTIPFEDLNSAGISDIYHCAAVTRFNVEEDLANKVNLEGSKKVFEFAKQCSDLKKIHHISTIYVSGLREGNVSETPLDNIGFANHYERSKWETENSLINDFKDLPWNIYRVATILCDDDEGNITQLNAVHNTLKLLYYGLISLVPGKKNTPVYLVTGDFSAKSIVELAKQDLNHQIFNICYEKESSLTLESLINIAFDSFLEEETFKKKGIKKPLYVDEESFEVLSSGVSGFGGDILNDALKSVSPFSKQLFLEKDFENSNLKKYLKSYMVPDATSLLENTIKNIIETKWKRH